MYSHLLRHSWLEGRPQLRFSIQWLARGACISTATARKAVRSLVGKGALRLTERSKAGHVVTVRLPEEIRSVCTDKIPESADDRLSKVGRLPNVGDLEKADFLETRALREAIHEREGGRCFYCLGRLRPMVRCLDHVVARVRGGGNGYRNLVSACSECNSQKGEGRAEDFLRWLWREGRLSASELSRTPPRGGEARRRKASTFAPAKRAERTTRASEPERSEKVPVGRATMPDEWTRDEWW